LKNLTLRGYEDTEDPEEETYYPSKENPRERRTDAKPTIPSKQRTKENDAGKNATDNFDSAADSDQSRPNPISISVPAHNWRTRLCMRY